jgi:hypothetical protein
LDRLGNTFVQGRAVGNSYFYMRFDQDSGNGGHGLFKDNLLVSRIHSSTYGKMINADEQDCHFGNIIYTYLTTMVGIHKEGSIVRIDKRTNDKQNRAGQGPSVEQDIEYIVNNDVIDFSRYWTTNGNMEKGILSVSFVFNKKGEVSDLVVNAPDKDGLSTNIYLVRYLGDGQIGVPEILVTNATLFGVVKKSGGK